MLNSRKLSLRWVHMPLSIIASTTSRSENEISILSSLSSPNDCFDDSKEMNFKQYQRNHHHLVIPSCLLGGTAVAYSHFDYRGLNTSLNPIASVCMLLLAVQYAILPKLSKTYIGKNSSKVQTALTEEITKSTLALALFLTFNSYERIRYTLSQWNIYKSLSMAGIPSILYAIQGVLQYQSHQYIDSVTFNGLQQSKTLSAAFFCFVLLKKSLSLLQITSLFILFWSSLLFQAPIPNKNKTSYTNEGQTVRFWQGIFPCVIATILSGLAGALSQRGLQKQSSNPSILPMIDPFFYALEVSMYSAVVLVVVPILKKIMTLFQIQRQQYNAIEKVSKSDGHRENNWNWQLLLPTACKAFGGILTVLVHQHAGTVSKGFALTFGLVLSACFESALTGQNMTMSQVVGTALVVVATWMQYLV